MAIDLYRSRNAPTLSIAGPGVLGACVLALGLSSQSGAWRDPSPHQVRRVTVDSSVQLEVLEWGGSGPPVVFLACYVSAHVYDEFAPKLTNQFHVLGMTRRGIGASDKPATGYAVQRSANDVLEVLNALKVQKSLLVGHSCAGQILTMFAAQHSDRLLGLVYLDGASDPTLTPVDVGAPMPDRALLPRSINPPSAPDNSSFEALRVAQRRDRGWAFPEAELRQQYVANPDGSVGRSLLSPEIRRAITVDARVKPDYSGIRVPVLAIYPKDPPFEEVAANFLIRNEQERSALRQEYAATRALYGRWQQDLLGGVPTARIVELQGASLYMFQSNEADVLREIRAFAATLTRDYPQWRGKDRDGSASGFVQPPRWPDALTRRWRVEVGEGYASPLVVGNIVYVFSRNEGREVLSALDADTGARLWQSGYAVPYTPSGPTVAHGSGPKATPLFHDHKIITLGISGIVAAFEAQKGTLLWRTAEPSEVPFFSAASSPVGEGRFAITHPGNYGPLTAFDVSSGKVAWKAGGDAFFMSPNVVTLQGIRQVVSVTQTAVIGVAAEDGRLLWEFPWSGGRSGGIMPIPHGDKIIVSATSAGVLAISPRYRNGSWLVEKAWETPAVEMYISHPVLIGDTLFGFSRRGSGQLFALDARDGRVLWVGEPRFATNVAFATAGGLLFVLKDDAELIIARANPSGFERLKSYEVADGATWAQPVVSGLRLFVKDVSTLTLWTFD